MALKRREIRHEKLHQYLKERPFMTDEELAEKLDVSISTIRLDRSELGIPELRERTRAVASQAYDALKALDQQEVIGSLSDLKIGDYGSSELLIRRSMVLEKAGVARGHHLFAQANSLAIAVVNADMALTGSVSIKFIRPVRLGEVVKAEATVTRRKANRCWIRVVSKVNGERVLEGEWTVFAFQGALETIKSEGGTKMKIAIDAMGGDFAPQEIVKGAVDAAKIYPQLGIILVGAPDRIEAAVLGGDIPANITIHPASEVVEMDEHPANAVRKKKDSSIVVATRLVKEKEADALVSAGSTGAQMAAALLGLGRVKGVERPAIATVLPTLKGGKLMLDVGANPDASPEHLRQYGLMGSIYAEKILGIKSPRVGLLNIGAEETKGNQLTQAAYPLLKAAPINFVGNIEGRYVPYGQADVVVCEAFVGNVMLKMMEGLAGVLFEQIKEKITSTALRKLGAAMVKPGLKEVAHMLDYAEYGGAPLLGVNGISIICHGSSKARAITSAVRVAQECVQSGFIETIRTELAVLQGPSGKQGDIQANTDEEGKPAE